MIKILTSKQIRDLDAFTIEDESITSIDLMERACRAFADWIVQHVEVNRKIGVVCGTGNNGGDGLGVARMLHDWGYAVSVWIVRGSAAKSLDFKENFDRLGTKKITIVKVAAANHPIDLSSCDVIVDALFGSGLSRPVEGIYAEVIRLINATKCLRIAIDIPSGLPTDMHFQGEIVRADYTVSFQLPKLSFLLPQSFPYTGEWCTVDIGLNKEFIRESETDNYLITAKYATRLLKTRSKFDHKGIYGHALIVAGSFGKIGAAVLTSRAALRSGVGLVTVHSPACGYQILQTAVPEAMISVDSHLDTVSAHPTNLENFSTIAIGPGLGSSEETANALKNILMNFQSPVVLDADALNILSQHKELLKLIPKGSILTPHPKEFERLVGKWSNDFERLELQKDLSKRLQSIVVLKGAFSSITTPDGKAFFNSTGNPGMATGGSGDVLTGILGGLLAQKYTSEQSAILGVFIHGLAGDKAVEEKGMEALIASDLIEWLPKAFLSLKKRKFNPGI